MTIKSDRWIRQMAREHGMITPFAAEQVRRVEDQRVISYGLSSYGYDMRVADEFMYPVSGVLDPKRPGIASWETAGYDWHNRCPHLGTNEDGTYCEIPANSFVLARSVEYFRIPRNVMCICLGKSTYARISVHPHITPLEAGWEGYVTLEIANNSPLPARVYANEGIAQVLFFESDEACEISYADRDGKYQGQQGIRRAEA
jgi:dCTP deaminase